jgi:UDPglucose 6-dehydrogenase
MVKMRLCVIGSGYVGLVAGAGFADFGHDVACVDVDANKISRLQAGEIPIYEPGLDALVARNVKEGRLTFSTDVASGVAGAEITIIAVGTPQAQDGSADLKYVEAVADTIGRAMTGYLVIVNKSTVPVGTADRVRAIVGERTKHPFAVVSNPEFLKEGDALNDFMKPDRVIIGTDDARAREVMRQLYAPFVRTNDRIQLMDARSAELTKYAANCLLATRISFMNELSVLAERVGADIESVRKGIGADPRIGPKFLFPGPGFGGSCFPKDLKALLNTAKENDVLLEVVAAADRANARQKQVLPAKVEKHFGQLAGKTIAVWGLAFKPATDDVRESPALALIDRLLAAGARVHAHDPAAMENVSRIYGDRITLAFKPYDAVHGAHALVLVTEWHEYRGPDWGRIKAALKEPTIFDGRNIWSPEDLRARGFTYHGIGRR